MVQEVQYTSRIKEGITSFACERAHVDLCPKLLLETIRVRKETEKQLVSVLKERDKYRDYFQTLLSTVKSFLEPITVISNVFKHQLSKIPEIKARYFAETPKAISFWLFIEADNWEVEENIYEAFGELLDLFPDAEIDLRLLKLYGRKPKELLPKGFKPW